MRDRYWFAAIVLVAALGAATTAAQAREPASHDAKYPDIGGTWVRPGAAQWDPTKPAGLRQQAPLTPEYQTLFETNLDIAKSGGQEYNPQVNCLPAGMPRVMIAYDPLEFIVTPDTTYIRSDHLAQFRRIYTDGRPWPEQIKPSFVGYSIGRWVDQDAEGHYGVLEVETRSLKGPRSLDASGLPLHADNQTIVKERIYLDQANRNLLHDQVTTVDHAYTRPWTIVRSYNRDPDPVWVENNCGADNHYVSLGKETYFISADGYLMPTKKNQPVPALEGFGQPQQ
ncbi:MAG TPA: hypothetical protein VG291_04825 [Xanthobacteraceae bacterium]|nr:hypothetical protein [Xanthobacteraceae bacterium]